MPDHYARVRLTDPAEIARLRTLSGDPILVSYLEAGAKAAHEIFVPALKAGHYGITEQGMQAGVARALRTMTDAPRKAGLPAMTQHERFMYRLGFEAVALPAKDEALAAVGAGALLFLAAMIAAHPAPSRGTCRPLRPEDFGALPAMRAGPGPRPNFDSMATRTATAPSPGVGPIHGSGEPPSDHPPAR